MLSIGARSGRRPLGSNRVKEGRIDAAYAFYSKTMQDRRRLLHSHPFESVVYYNSGFGGAEKSEHELLKTEALSEIMGRPTVELGQLYRLWTLVGLLDFSPRKAKDARP